jgi:hypothetical protein
VEQQRARPFAVFLSLLCIASAGAASPVADRARGSAGWSRVDDHTLRFEGRTEQPQIARFEALFGPAIDRIIVNSAGGPVGGALPIALRLQERRVDLIVDGLCASSCANYFFVAARRKTVLPGSLVLFHGGIPDPPWPEDEWAAQLLPAWADMMKLPHDRAYGDPRFKAEVRTMIAEVAGQFEMQRKLFRRAGVPTVFLADADALTGPYAGPDGPKHFWAPPPELMRRCYGVKGLARMWYPPSAEGLASAGAALDDRLVLTARAPPRCSGRSRAKALILLQ